MLTATRRRESHIKVTTGPPHTPWEGRRQKNKWRVMWTSGSHVHGWGHVKWCGRSG